MNRSCTMEKLLYVNLSKKQVTEITINHRLEEEFVGGKGFGAKILYDLLPPGCDPLSPQNVLMFMTGPLTGTLAPAMRGCVVTKSPLTGTFADSYFGGHFAQEIRYCGFDGIIITGKAAESSYLWISDGTASIHPAQEIWGLDTFAAVEKIRELVGDQSVKTACIGPAGENMVSHALINCEYNRHAGRGGTGAVMGAKNLKAIALRGTKTLAPADQNGFMTIVDQAYKELAESEEVQSFNSDGTAGSIDFANLEQLLPTYNYYDGTYNEATRLNGEAQRRTFWLRNTACAACPIACGKVGSIRRGRHKGLISDVVEYETAAMLGSNLGISDIREVAYLVKKCDALGLDGMSAGGVAGFAIEAFQKGLLNSGDTEGHPLEFGNVSAVDYLLEKIAFRSGIGNLLAKGVKEAAKELNRGAEDFAVHVKGLESPAWGPRSVPGMGLALATADRGGCHQRALPVLYEIGGEWKGEMVERHGLKYKGEIVVHQQNYLAALDTLVKCDFGQYGIKAETYCHLMETALGRPWDVEKLMKLGDKIWNQIRLFNLREGFSREDDTLPKRFTEEPLPEGPYQGELITKTNLDQMLDDYYAVRGWDDFGKPTEDKLKELGLEAMPTLVQIPTGNQ